MLILQTGVISFPLTENFMNKMYYIILVNIMNFRVSETWAFIPTELFIINY